MLLWKVRLLGKGILGIVLITCLIFLSKGVIYGQDIYKIGAVLQMTGSAGSYGPLFKSGCELAMEDINAQGGIKDKKLEILFEDSRSLPTAAIAAMKKLCAIDKVPAVIMGGSGLVLASASVANGNKVVLVNGAALSPKIKEAGEYVFSSISDASVEVKWMAEYLIKKRGIKKVALFYLNNEMGLGAKDEFEKEFLKNGGHIVAIESHEENTTDVRTQLAKIKSAKPEAVYLASHHKESGLVMKQAGIMGVKTKDIPWFSFAPMEGPATIELGGAAAEGIVYTAPAFDPTGPDPKMREFGEKYKKKYGNLPGLYSATMYDGVQLIAWGISNSTYSGEGIKIALEKVKDFPGVSGRITIDQHAVIGPIILKTVRDGKFVRY